MGNENPGGITEMVRGESGDDIASIAEQAYAAYDRDPRVHGPYDYEAFCDAITLAVAIVFGDRIPR